MKTCTCGTELRRLYSPGESQTYFVGFWCEKCGTITTLKGKKYTENTVKEFDPRVTSMIYHTIKSCEMFSKYEAK